MAPRDPHEPHRTATTLELFFDLVFVIAVSAVSSQLHHQLAEAHWSGIITYGMLFFGIWWAWMNFTWFATSFGTDDWLYRVLTVVQMAGVLLLAAGVGPAFNEGDFTLTVVGYVVMRVALIAQWLRASRSAGKSRRATLFYAYGTAIVQLFWLPFLLLPQELKVIGFLVLAAAELSVPVIAELRGQTPWHPHHISERYGLFTIIVLGESLLASANAIIGAIEEVEAIGPLLWIAVLTLVATAAMWWIYFWPPHHKQIGAIGSSLKYGYGHYFIFAAAAAFSAGIEVEIDRMTGHSDLEFVTASFTVSVPIAIFLLGVWLIAIRPNADAVVNTAMPIGAALVLLDPILPFPATLVTLILVAIVVVLVLRRPVEKQS